MRLARCINDPYESSSEYGSVIRSKVSGLANLGALAVIK